MNSPEFGFSISFNCGGETRLRFKGSLTPEEAEITKQLVDLWSQELVRRIDQATVVPAFPAHPAASGGAGE